jgi:uncharacterized protein (TIGR00730 family)
MERARTESHRRVCVFCGSSNGVQNGYREAAQILGKQIAEAGLGLVYGGAHVGLMGTVADATLAAGGEVIGVIPKQLVDRELAHQNLSRLYVVETMHERKAKMAAESDAFVALPGGYGTLDEFFEIVTWSMLGIHHKPCLLVNTSGYYDPLLAFVRRASEQGFVSDKGKKTIQVAKDARDVVPLLEENWRWSKPEQRFEVQDGQQVPRP